MDSPFLGTIILFGGTFAPQGWAYCWGQLLNITQYQALYSILGLTYGGDGKTTFALPDLRGAVPMGFGTPVVPGRITSALGQRGGSSTTTLTLNNIPSHTHTFNGQPQGTSLSTAASTTTYTIPATNAVQGNGNTPDDKSYLAQAVSATKPAQVYNNTITTPNVQMPGGTINIPSVAVTGTIGTISGTTAATGNGQAVSTMSPYVAMNYIIALEGLYPMRP